MFDNGLRGRNGIRGGMVCVEVGAGVGLKSVVWWGEVGRRAWNLILCGRVWGEEVRFLGLCHNHFVETKFIRNIPASIQFNAPILVTSNPIPRNICLIQSDPSHPTLVYLN